MLTLLPNEEFKEFFYTEHILLEVTSAKLTTNSGSSIVKTMLLIYSRAYPYHRSPVAPTAPSYTGWYPPVVPVYNPHLVANYPRIVSGVITPVIGGLTLLIPFINGVITHLLSGMSHQA
jgi:hypothetical protein